MKYFRTMFHNLLLFCFVFLSQSLYVLMIAFLMYLFSLYILVGFLKNLFECFDLYSARQNYKTCNSFVVSCVLIYQMVCDVVNLALSTCRYIYISHNQYIPVMIYFHRTIQDLHKLAHKIIKQGHIILTFTTINYIEHDDHEDELSKIYQVACPTIQI